MESLRRHREDAGNAALGATNICPKPQGVGKEGRSVQLTVSEGYRETHLRLELKEPIYARFYKVPI